MVVEVAVYDALAAARLAVSRALLVMLARAGVADSTETVREARVYVYDEGSSERGEMQPWGRGDD